MAATSLLLAVAVVRATAYRQLQKRRVSLPFRWSRHISSRHVLTNPGPACSPAGPLVVARSAAFNVAASVWTLASVLVAALCLLLPPGAILAVSRVWMGGLQFLLRHLVGLDYEVRGLANMPQGPAIYAFKHQSAWETVVIHLLLPKAAIALKRELMQIPLFGWCLRRSGMIGINRAGRIARCFADRRRPGRARARRLRDHLPRRTSHPAGPACALSSRRGRALPGTRSAGRAGRPQLRPVLGRRSFLKRPGRIVVQFLEPIEPGLDRKTFMAKLRRRLEGGADRLIEEAGGVGLNDQPPGQRMQGPSAMPICSRWRRC